MSVDICTVGTLLHDVYVIKYGSNENHAHKSADRVILWSVLFPTLDAFEYMSFKGLERKINFLYIRVRDNFGRLFVSLNNRRVVWRDIQNRMIDVVEKGKILTLGVIPNQKALEVNILIYSKILDLDLYKTMLLIRNFEQRSADAYIFPRKINGTLHPCIGQEAVATGVCKALHMSDFIVTTHRGHGHMIAKGANIKQMAAELFGKSTGCCGGKGGSMHISDFSVGSLGANAILGAGFTIATGSTFATKYLQKDHITVCFFGDGAFSEGALHEALNISAIWKLPVLFVCENNQYALSTPYKKTIATQDLSKIAIPYNISSLTIDGNDVLEIYKVTSE